MSVKLIDVVTIADVFIAKCGRSGEDSLMNRGENFHRLADEFFFVDERFFVRCLIATRHRHLAGFKIARANLNADRHTFFHPLPFFDTTTDVAGIDVHAEGIAVVKLIAQGAGKCLAGIDYGIFGVFFGRYGNDHDLLRGDARWQDQAIVIGVGHNQRADHARGHTP